MAGEAEEVAKEVKINEGLIGGDQMQRTLLLLLVVFGSLVTKASQPEACFCPKVPDTEVTRPGANETIVWQLSKPYQLFHGTTVTLGTQPLENVLIEIFPDERYGKAKQERLAACLTGKDGRFCFKQLPKGRYKVVSSLDGGWKHSVIYLKIDPSNKRSERKPFEIVMNVGT